jgi:hypothetical protein
MRSLFVLLVSDVLVLIGCIGPVSLHRAVLEYDKTVQHLESEMLLLNIARLHHNLPDHYTVTSAIAASFVYRSAAGFTGAFPGFANNKNKWSIDLGVEAAENPTLSIVPIQGEEFTRRILDPMEDEKLAFLAFQGAPFDLLTRLMARGIEVQKRDGTFVRFILNRPRVPEEYWEFRQRVLHLQWLGQNRKLFVKPIDFIEAVQARLASEPSAGDIARALEKGYRWRRLNGKNEYELTRRVTGRIAVTNYDASTLTNAERSDLNALAASRPKNFVLVDIRPGFPGGDYPLFGGIKLRSLNAILAFLADTISHSPEFDVAPDARTGPVERNPQRAMAIQVTDATPDTMLSVKFAEQYYSVPNTDWDRFGFIILYKLFQMTVTDVSAVGVPITIAK